MALSPGTERAIVDLARIAPKFTKALEEFNKNMDSLTTLGNLVLSDKSDPSKDKEKDEGS